MSKKLLLTLSLVSAVLIAEAGVRLAGPRDFGFNDSIVYSSNPRGYYEQVAVKGAEAVYGLQYNTDREGYRLPDGVAGWGGARGARREEILALGDSFTFGRGVRYEDTYPSQLEKLLAADGPGWRVFNAGVVGADAERVERVYDREAAGKKYKLVVYGFVLNDFDPVFKGGGAGADLAAGNNGSAVRRGPRRYSALLDLLFGLAERKRVTRETTAAYLESFRGGNASEKYAVLRRLNAKVKADGGKLVIMIFPLLYAFRAYPFREIHSSLLAFCAGEGIPCLDLLPVFSRHRASELWAAPNDQHPNEIAQREAAERLEEFLRGKSLLPARRSPSHN